MHRRSALEDGALRSRYRVGNPVSGRGGAPYSIAPMLGVVSRGWPMKSWGSIGASEVLSVPASTSGLVAVGAKWAGCVNGVGIGVAYHGEVRVHRYDGVLTHGERTNVGAEEAVAQPMLAGVEGTTYVVGVDRQAHLVRHG